MGVSSVVETLVAEARNLLAAPGTRDVPEGWRRESTRGGDNRSGASRSTAGGGGGGGDLSAMEAEAQAEAQAEAKAATEAEAEAATEAATEMDSSMAETGGKNIGGGEAGVVEVLVVREWREVGLRNRL